MKIQVDVKANARHKKIKLIGENHYRAAVKAPPHEGKANQEVLALLAQYLKLPKSSLSIVRGHKSKKKWVKVH